MKKILFAVVLSFFFNLEAHAMVQFKDITYKVDGSEYTGYLVFDDEISGKRPGILVVHDWWGHSDYARQRANMLAKLGYTAFALDMYGTGKFAKHPDDAKKFMTAAIGQLPEAEKRFKAAYEVLSKHPTVDTRKIAAIGYCMGGGIVIHMGRTGVVDLKAVISYHGALGFSNQAPAKPNKVKVLAFTGGADPLVPKEEVQTFVDVMTASGIEYELKSFPGVKHGFTSTEADINGKKFGLPLAYSKAADEDSWRRTQTFLKQIFW